MISKGFRDRATAASPRPNRIRTAKRPSPGEGQRPFAIVKGDVSGVPDQDDLSKALPYSVRVNLLVAPDQPEHPNGQ